MKRLPVLAALLTVALLAGLATLPAEAACKYCDGRDCADAPNGQQGYSKCSSESSADGSAGFCAIGGASCTGAGECLIGDCEDVQNASVTPNGEASPSFIERTKTCSVARAEKG